MTTTPVFVFLRVFSIGALVAYLLVVRECSCFSPRQNTGVSRLGSSSSPSFAATVDEIDNNNDNLAPSTSNGLFPDSLFEAVELASIPRSAETETGAHDAFRFEWGRWVDDEAVAALMEKMNEMEIPQPAEVYDRLLELPKTISSLPEVEDEITVDEDKDNEIDKEEDMRRRYRISGGNNWDCILHILPKEMEWRGRWPTGSWAVVRCLTGMAELNLMRGPDRDGFYKKATTSKLRGGGDGTLGGGTVGRGEDCVKYVGGALRNYSGVGGKTMLLEVVIRPPMGKAGIDGDGFSSLDMETFPVGDPIITEIWNSAVEEELSDLDETESIDEEQAKIDQQAEEDKESSSTTLGAQMGLTFEKVGGLDDQLNDIVRRVLASR